MNLLFLLYRWVTKDVERPNGLTASTIGNKWYFSPDSLPLPLFLPSDSFYEGLLVQCSAAHFTKQCNFFVYPSLKSTHFNFARDERGVMVSIYVKTKECSVNCDHLWLPPTAEIGTRWLLKSLATQAIQWFCFHYGNLFTKSIPNIYSMKGYSI